MASNDTEELTLTGSLVGQVHVNTHHFRVMVPGPISPSTEQALIDEWQAGCQVAYLGIFGVAYQLALVSARQICGALPLRARIDETVALAGTRASASIQSIPWLAVLVRERTPFAGRSHQGRNFYAIGGEDDFTQNALQPIIINAVNAYNTALMATFGAGGTSGNFQLAVHSHKLASVPGTQCQNSSTLVQSLSTSPFVTSMRSRRSRSGA